MALHSSTLAWEIPWTEEPGRLQSMGWQRVGHDWVTSLSLFTFMHWGRKWQPTPVFMPGESQRRGSLVGCRLWVAQSRTRLKRLSSVSSFPGTLPISSSFVWSCGFLPCSFICWVFLWLFILFNLLLLGVSFLQPARSWFLLFGDSAPRGCGWTSALWRFLSEGNWCLCSLGGNWILFLWRSVPCSVGCLGVSVNLVWLWAACLLGRIMFLICWLFGVRHPALELAALWVGPGLSVEMEAFGRAVLN